MQARETVLFCVKDEVAGYEPEEMSSCRVLLALLSATG